MADLLAEHLDLDAVTDLLAGGAPSRPVITSHLERR
jgi:adenosylcobyric acid synthase